MESRKVVLYICGMKTIKIADRVHMELKRFVANHEGESMENVATFSIQKYLVAKNHAFLPPVPTKERISTKIQNGKK